MAGPMPMSRPISTGWRSWDPAGHGGDPDWRGKDGPLSVTRGTREIPLHQAFVEAGRQAGFELTADYNGEKQEGFGPMEMTVRNGQRWSAANAYLKPALKRPNLDMVKCFARRVVIEDGRAVGVEVERAGQVQVIRAREGGDPRGLVDQLAQAADALRHRPCRASGRARDRGGGRPPRCGQNLQDHLELYIQQACTQPITLFKHWNLIGKGLVGLEWLLRRTGPGASNQFESAAFLRSARGRVPGHPVPLPADCRAL